MLLIIEMASPQITLKPVKTERDYGSGTIFLGFGIIILLLGIVLYLYSSRHHNVYPQGGESFPSAITNKTKLSYKLSFSNKILNPGEEIKINLGQHTTISALSSYSDGTPIMHRYTLSNKNANKIYITPSGFRTNLSSADDVEFINQSHFPVMFVQLGRGNRRWIESTVPAGTSDSGHFVPFKSKWQIVHLYNQDALISELTVSGRAKKLVFDGSILKAY